MGPLGWCIVSAMNGAGKGLVSRVRQGLHHSEVGWRLRNLHPTIENILHPPRAPQAVIDGLNRDGIAITTVDALGIRDLFERVSQEVHELERDALDAIEAARGSVEEADVRKTFLYPLLPERPSLSELPNVSALALNDSVLRIAAAYFGMWTTLRYFNVWHTLVTRGEPRRSQLWHRDPEDRRILKMFVYLSDVDRGAGPLTYAGGSHSKGDLRQHPEGFRETGRGALRSTDEQMACIVPRSRWVEATGPRGTVVFADTRGYHKGGLARTRDRLLFNSLYVSGASNAETWIASGGSGLEGSPRQRYACRTIQLK
jgi:hypothetical protein